MWSTSKGGPVFSKLFRLDRTDPLSFGPKFREILVEWIAPYEYTLLTYVSSDVLGYLSPVLITIVAIAGKKKNLQRWY